MKQNSLDSENALEQATLVLFRQLGWDMEFGVYLA
jgi:hypothetical protein